MEKFEIIRITGVAMGVGFNETFPDGSGTYSESICETMYDTGNDKKDAAESEKWANRICDALNNKQQEAGWISVEENLPPNLAFCWIYSNTQGKVIMSIFSKKDNWFQSLSGSYVGVAGRDVTFYQPLIFPNPPKF